MDPGQIPAGRIGDPQSDCHDAVWDRLRLVREIIARYLLRGTNLSGALHKSYRALFYRSLLTRPASDRAPGRCGCARPDSAGRQRRWRLLVCRHQAAQKGNGWSDHQRRSQNTRWWTSRVIDAGLPGEARTRYVQAKPRRLKLPTEAERLLSQQSGGHSASSAPPVRSDFVAFAATATMVAGAAYNPVQEAFAVDQLAREDIRFGNL